MTARAHEAQQHVLDLQPLEIPKAPRTGVLRSFHNRGGAPTADVAQRQSERNQSQQQRVLEYLRDHPGQRYTPRELSIACGIPRENSVSRSLSDLKELGLVNKWTGDRRMGSWGTEVCTWSARG